MKSLKRLMTQEEHVNSIRPKRLMTQEEHVNSILPRLANAYYHTIQILRKIHKIDFSNFDGYDHALKEPDIPCYRVQHGRRFTKRIYVGLVSHLIEHGGYRKSDFGPMVNLFKLKFRDPIRFFMLDEEQKASILAIASVANSVLDDYSNALFAPWVLKNERGWRETCFKENKAYEILEIIREYFGKNPLEDIEYINRRALGGIASNRLLE